MTLKSSRHLESHFDAVTRRIRERQARYRLVVAPLLAELGAAGFHIQHIEDLRGRPGYPEAVSILLRWLPKATDSSLKMKIAEALAVAGAGPRVAQALIDEYTRAEDPLLRDTIGLYLGVVAEDSAFGSMAALARREEYGKIRWSLIEAISALKTPKVEPLLLDLLRDETAAGAAVVALANREARVAPELIKQYLRDKNPAVRAAARRLLRPPVAPLALHVIRSNEGLPERLAEWSAALDLADLAKALRVVGRVSKVLGKSEVAEVVSVAKGMKLDETKWFRFPVPAVGREADLWLELYLDDVEAVDVVVYGDRALIEKLDQAWARSPISKK